MRYTSLTHFLEDMADELQDLQVQGLAPKHCSVHVCPDAVWCSLEHSENPITKEIKRLAPTQHTTVKTI